MESTDNSDSVAAGPGPGSALERAKAKVAIAQIWWEFVAPKVVGIGSLGTGIDEIIHPNLLPAFHHPEILVIAGLMFAGGEAVKKAVEPFFKPNAPGGG